MRDRTAPLPADLLEQRRLLRRRRPTRGRDADLAALDDRVDAALSEAVAHHSRDVEHRALDAAIWDQLVPQLRALYGPRGDLLALRTFLPGFGRWWFERVSAPLRDTPAHHGYGRALEILQRERVQPDGIIRLLARVRELRYPLLPAFGEWIEGQVRPARKRGAAARVKAWRDRGRHLGGYVSHDHQAAADIEARRMPAAHDFLRRLGPRAASVKNETRRNAVVRLVADLQAHGLSTRDASRVAGGLLAEAPETVRTLYQRHRK